MEKIREPRDFKQRGKEKYFVVSYSHRDRDVVFRELCILEDNNVLFWFDKENHIGEDWFDNIKNHLDDDNCVGVIIYVSENTLISKNVLRELAYIDELKQTKKLTVFCVFIDNKNSLKPISINNLLSESVNLIQSNSKINMMEAMQSTTQNCAYINSFTANGDRLYGHTCLTSDCPYVSQKANCPCSDSLSCKYKFDIIDKAKSLKAIYTNQTVEVEQEESSSNLKILDTYKRTSITWDLVSVEKNEYLFLCSHTLELALEEDIDATLEQIKDKINFIKTSTDWAFHKSAPIRLLTVDEYEQYKKSIKKVKIIDKKNTIAKYWWLDGETYSPVLADGSILKYTLYEHESLGVRPLLVLRSLKEE